MLVHSNGRNSTEFCVGLRFARPTPTPPDIRSIKIEFHLTNAGEFRPLGVVWMSNISQTTKGEK